jgi:hypothetical protein
MGMVLVGISYSPLIFMIPPFTNPLVSIVSHLPAHLSPFRPIHCWPTHLHCATYTGPPVSIAPYPLLAHSSSSHTVIHNVVYSTLLYHLYYIPWAHLFRTGTHHPPAHPSIMVQLLSWAHMGQPVSLGTLSPSAVCLRWVNSLNGLGMQLAWRWRAFFTRLENYHRLHPNISSHM